MSAYFFFDVHEICDPEKASEYRSGVFATVEAFGGTYRILGGQCESIEGNWAPGIPVLIEFSNRETARAWYDSDVYRPLKDLRMEAMDSSALLVDGFDHQKAT